MFPQKIQRDTFKANALKCYAHQEIEICLNYWRKNVKSQTPYQYKMYASETYGTTGQ